MKKNIVLVTAMLLAVGTACAQGKPEADFIPVDVEPAIVSRANPEYPKEALSKGLEGMVWLKVFVSEQGTPNKVEVLKSSDAVFEKAAIDAARQFRFTPAEIKKKPVAVWVSIPFKFKLSPKPDIIKKNSEELPKKIKNPTVLIIEGPKDLDGKITYPAEAIGKRIEGAVFANVVLNEQGGISELKITKRLGGGCDEEVLKALTTHRFNDEKSEADTDKSLVKTFPVVVQFVLPAK